MTGSASTSPIGMFPTALILGASGTAAAWLRSLLSQRGDVYVPVGDSTFFSGAGHHNLLGYRLRFRDWAGERVRVDIEPSCMRARARPDLMAARMAGAMPELRLVAVVRSPAARAVEAFARHQWHGRIPQETTLTQYVRTTDHGLDPLEIVAGGLYADLLQPYRDRFGSRLHVVVEEDLIKDPPSVWHDLVGFLDCEDFSAPAPRSLLRLRANARAPWDPDAVPPTLADFELLCSYYASSAGRLETLIGRRLPAAWCVP